ncbi:MAG: RtcB family protein [Oscillospiraceae bacterium]|jgi:RNA-splicing ligase RtcB|nr:RtcB family protein [Oscillospiraceae bacterium]
MIELQGKYNTAKMFTDSAEQYAIAQVINLLNQEFVSGSKIRLMPDAHPGEGCTIGTTMTITDKVVPNLVGVDIGCGMETVLLRDTRVELQQLDKAIHKLIPAGFNVRKTAHTYADEPELTKLRCAKHVSLDRARLSVGTLGGGNHFIELDRDDDGRLYLVIHTGSRNLGKQVAEFYQKSAGGSTLAYVEGALLDDYLHDMAIVQRYADINRAAIARDIIKEMKFKVDERFSTVHNYIDLDSMILRKGAISARSGERVLIPMNMRDGSLICVGRGNPDWNFSAPHGAGRLMSRSDAKQSVTLTQFEKSMEGIYSTTVKKSTIDESPFAYKPMDEIIANIADTAEIVKTIKPVYNFKAAE